MELHLKKQGYTNRFLLLMYGVHFFRVNRTFIVRVDAIKDIIAYTNSRLKIVLNSYSETEIIVSRERVKEFKNWID